MIRSLPRREPSSLAPDNPSETHARASGLKQESWAFGCLFPHNPLRQITGEEEMPTQGCGWLSTSMKWLTGNEESIVSVTRRVLLGLEESVEIPETALYEVIGWHLRESKIRKWQNETENQFEIFVHEQRICH